MGKLEILFGIMKSFNYEFVFFSGTFLLVVHLDLLLVQKYFVVHTVLTLANGAALEVVFEAVAVPRKTSVVLALAFAPLRVQDDVLVDADGFLAEGLLIDVRLFFSREAPDFLQSHQVLAVLALALRSADFPVFEAVAVQSQATGFFRARARVTLFSWGALIRRTFELSDRLHVN